MINEGFMKVLQWFCDRFADFNLITMVMVPLFVSVSASMLVLWFTRRDIKVSELRQRVILLNDHAQTKMVPHKERKDQLMSMGSSSLLDNKLRIIGALEEIIDGTVQVLGKLNDRKKFKKLKKIEIEVGNLEEIFGQIPNGAKTPETREAILQK